MATTDPLAAVQQYIDAFNKGDAENWVKAGGVLKEHISFEGIRCCEVVGDRAYAVISATLTITLKAGEPIVRPGILVYSFAKQREKWKAEGHTWGRLS